MVKSAATPSPTPVSLDGDSTVPLYRQIYDEMTATGALDATFDRTSLAITPSEPESV